MRTIQVIYNTFEKTEYLDAIRDELIYNLDRKAEKDFRKQF
jgi:hypothetical protein